jgi:ATP-dependent protease ClpP protease subunit
MSLRKLASFAAITSSTVGSYCAYSWIVEEKKRVHIENYKDNMVNIWKNIQNKNPKKYNKDTIVMAIHDRKNTNFWDNINNNELYYGIDLCSALSIVRSFKNNTSAFKTKYDTENNKIENKTNETYKCDIVIFIDTCGGEIGAIKMICDAIKTFKKKFKGKCIVIIPEKAFSGGTIIALTADEIMMNEYSLISKINPQVMNIPIKHFEQYNSNFIDRILYGIAKDANGTMNNIINEHIKPQYEKYIFDRIMKELLSSNSLHEQTYNKEDCEQLGLNITLIPDEVNSKLNEFVNNNIE